jgi:sec-independent protein translocase protein TatB
LAARCRHDSRLEAGGYKNTVFLFILESIGTSELLLIGVIALMFLGPRKLPGIARTIGKYMADFRNTTQEFKSTWEKEVDFAMEEETAKKEADEHARQQVARLSPGSAADSPAQNEISMPEIKQIDESAFTDLLPKTEEWAVEAEETRTTEPETTGKQDWL